MGNAIVKLVKKGKEVEGFLKRRNLVLSDSEEEKPKAQGRKSQDDPLDSLVTGWLSFLRPKEIQEKKRGKGNKVVSSLVFQEEVDAGAEQVNTAEGINTGSIKLSTVSEEVNTAEGVNAGSIKLSTVGAEKSTSSHDKGQREESSL
ncbi:hypothetical protein Tco_0455990 [Tanacetum coccineum]